MCTHYQLPDGTLTDQMPYDLIDGDVTPVYVDFKGWQTSLDGIRAFDDMPAELTAYVDFLEAELNLPITLISTGPDREAIINRSVVA